jgi:hypothetical protein
MISEGIANANGCPRALAESQNRQMPLLTCAPYEIPVTAAPAIAKFILVARAITSPPTNPHKHAPTTKYFLPKRSEPREKMGERTAVAMATDWESQIDFVGEPRGIAMLVANYDRGQRSGLKTGRGDAYC